MILLLTSLTLLACGDDLHTVTFIDHAGNELKTEKVEDGEHATAPAVPTRDGYTFIGWSHSVHVVREDLTIRAIYRLDGLMDALNAWINTVHNGQNYTDTIEIYQGNAHKETRVFKRTSNMLYTQFDFGDDSAEIYMQQSNEEFTWYERDLGKACFDIVETDQSAWNMFAVQSSRRAMIPTQVEPSWFNFDDNVLTLKEDYYTTFRNYVSAQGAFESYKITVHEDALEIVITFIANEVRHRHEIRIDNVNSTSLTIPTTLCE